tara:strand:- start:618 stop:818 length:201 start_codon:yes stop_codon:yes gene_type:complete
LKLYIPTKQIEAGMDRKIIELIFDKDSPFSQPLEIQNIKSLEINKIKIIELIEMNLIMCLCKFNIC